MNQSHSAAEYDQKVVPIVPLYQESGHKNRSAYARGNRAYWLAHQKFLQRSKKDKRGFDKRGSESATHSSVTAWYHVQNAAAFVGNVMNQVATMELSLMTHAYKRRLPL